MVLLKRLIKENKMIGFIASWLIVGLIGSIFGLYIISRESYITRRDIIVWTLGAFAGYAIFIVTLFFVIAFLLSDLHSKYIKHNKKLNVWLDKKVL
jgi:hypothetical protein